MNIKSKVLSVSIAAAISLMLPAYGFAAGNPFTDIENASAKDKIIALQNKGYVAGVSNGVFAPDRSVTAAEGIQLIVNAFNLNLDNVRFIKEPKATDYYLNADDDAWYANALIISAVKGLEISKDIDPNQKWTREEFTYHLVKAAEKNGNLPMINIVPVEISDQDQISIEYSGAIQRSFVYEIAQLDGEKKFNPKSEISRAEAAEQIYNALQYIGKHQKSLANP